MNSEQACELVAATVKECHKDARASKAVTEHVETLEARIDAAEKIMFDAAQHLKRRQMGPCNNTLAARMFDWIDGMEEEA